MCEHCGVGPTCCVCGRGCERSREIERLAAERLEQFFRWKTANPEAYRREVDRTSGAAS